MTWDSFRMGDLFHVKHGYAFKGQYFESDGPYVLLTPGSFNEEGGFRDQGEKTKFYTGDVPEGYVLDEGDLLVAMTEQAPGLLGSSAWIPEGGRFLHNQRLGKIVDLDGRRLNKRFLYYLFNTSEVRQQISARATGGKVRHTAPERIGQVVVQLPPLQTQHQIADVLCTYDDLIENNRRRMALLEEAVRQLYREWFVRFRFPGHEHTRVTSGGPEGWEMKTLGDCVDIKKGRSITHATAQEGIVPVVAGGLEPAYYHNEANSTGPVVTISASGANSGFVKMYHEDIWASDCSFINSESTRYLYYFYCLLKSRQHEIFGFQKGAAQPHVYPKDLMRLNIVCPPDRLLEYFSDSVESSFELTKNLNRQQRSLVAARDLLMPRLMNGEIAV
jgi:type I restriction enzyme S subunit